MTATESATFDAHEAVISALQPYLDCATTGDFAALKDVMHEHARVVGWLQGEAHALSTDELIEALGHIGAAPNARHRVTSLEVSGKVASVRIEWDDWAGIRFTDFILLADQGDGSKISAKVFDSHGAS